MPPKNKSSTQNKKSDVKEHSKAKMSQSTSRNAKKEQTPKRTSKLSKKSRDISLPSPHLSAGEGAQAAVVAGGGVQAYFVVDDYQRTLQFYDKVFGATEVFRLEIDNPSAIENKEKLSQPSKSLRQKSRHNIRKKVVHAEIELGRNKNIIARLRICESSINNKPVDDDEHTHQEGDGVGVLRGPACFAHSAPSQNYFIRPYIFHPDCDGVFAAAVKHGAKAASSPTTFDFSGERSCAFTDPSGIYWTIITRVEDIAPKEAERRFYQQLSASSHPQN